MANILTIKNVINPKVKMVRPLLFNSFYKVVPTHPLLKAKIIPPLQLLFPNARYNFRFDKNPQVLYKCYEEDMSRKVIR